MVSFNRWRERRRNPWKAVALDAFALWRKENGLAKLYDYAALPDTPVVLDFGGFRGEWTQRILDLRADAHVHVFEPHPKFAAEIADRFAASPEVKVHACALGALAGTLRLSDEGDASSSVATADRAFDAPVVAVRSFFADHPADHIDLAKLNIEGGEYDLIPALAEAGVLARIARIQIQFHLFEPAMAALRDAARTELEKTHRCVWAYPYVWEEWVLKG